MNRDAVMIQMAFIKSAMNKYYKMVNEYEDFGDLSDEDNEYYGKLVDEAASKAIAEMKRLIELGAGVGV